MKRIKKSWIALLFGVLLLATLVGAVWARPQAHHAGFHYTVTIPGGHFHPQDDGDDWWNNGLYIGMSSGVGTVFAALPILPGNRTVESMTMYIKDDNGSAEAVLWLYRVKTDGTQQLMAEASSSGSSTAIRSFSDTSISYSTLWGGHGSYLRLFVGGPDIDLYSVQITYY